MYVKSYFWFFRLSKGSFPMIVVPGLILQNATLLSVAIATDSWMLSTPWPQDSGTIIKSPMFVKRGIRERWPMSVVDSKKKWVTNHNEFIGCDANLQFERTWETWRPFSQNRVCPSRNSPEFVYCSWSSSAADTQATSLLHIPTRSYFKIIASHCASMSEKECLRKVRKRVRKIVNLQTKADVSKPPPPIPLPYQAELWKCTCKDN